MTSLATRIRRALCRHREAVVMIDRPSGENRKCVKCGDSWRESMTGVRLKGNLRRHAAIDAQLTDLGEQIKRMRPDS